MIRVIANLGAGTLSALAMLGRFVLFLGQVIAATCSRPFYGREFRKALYQIGFLSLPVVGLTALFTGGALALQIYSGGARFSAQAVVPQIVAIGIVRELGPVLVGLMIAARVTSSIAAEIATMKVTEQLDALVTLSTDPLRFLTVPRVVAAVIAVPLLVAIGDTIGILGGYIVAVQRLGFVSGPYLQDTVSFLSMVDWSSSLIKGAVFGFIAASIGCYRGMSAQQGAAGVGYATKSAVVGASVIILAANLILTEMMFSL